ncbi:hypothetical protein ATO50_09475 [Aeromonas hydrophila]|nr:hypothetical protein ATO50_09475 [Aeromonas hydrophila]
MRKLLGSYFDERTVLAGHHGKQHFLFESPTTGGIAADVIDESVNHAIKSYGGSVNQMSVHRI